MYKKIIALFLCCLIVVSVAACNESKTPTTSPVEPVGYTATAYILDSWKDTSGESAVYITSIMLYSKDFYDCPDVSDVKILTDDQYENLTDVVEGSEITVYTMNESLHNGIYTHMKIKSPKLLDTKKIYVNLEGPIEYQENVKTSEEYLEVNGSLDGWASLLVQLSERVQPSAEDRCAMIDSLSYGVIELVNQNRDQFYYASSNSKVVIEGNKMVTKIFIDPVTNSDMNQIPDQLIKDGEVANIVDGKLVMSELDERLAIYSCVENGELLIGFETIDGSDFKSYNGEVPDAIVYDKVEGCTHCLIVKR